MTIIDSKSTRIFLEMMFKKVNMDSEVLLREHIISSVITMTKEYLNRIDEKYSKDLLFVRYACIACYWILEKWDADYILYASDLRQIICIDFDIKYLLKMELDILTKLDFNLCKYVSGIHPSYPPVHNNILGNVLTDIIEYEQKSSIKVT